MPRAPKPNQNSAGYWRCTIRGERHQLGKDRAEAFRRFAELMGESEYNAAAIAQPDLTKKPRTIADLIARWLDRDNTEKRHIWTAQFLGFAGDMRLGSVGVDLLSNYADHLRRSRYQRTDVNGAPLGKPKQYAAETIRNYLREARAVLRFAHQREWLKRLPDMPRLEQTEFTDKSLTPAVLAERLANLPEKAQRLLRFIVATGCRPSEAINLRWSDVQIAARVAVITKHKTAKKTGKPRTIVLTPEALAVLRDTPRTKGEHAEYVFLSRNHRPYTVAGLRTICRRHLKCTTYALRHTYAQAAIDAGHNPETVSALLGHKTSAMVWTYAEIKQQALIEAASTLRIAEAG